MNDTMSICKEQVVHILRNSFTDVMAVYAFGSRITGGAHADSDLDLAIFVPGYTPELIRWKISNQIANHLGIDVDLVDLRSASTVMQHQIIMQGECWWKEGISVDLYELFILREKMDLDEARKGYLEDIQRDGHVYAR